MYMLYSYLKFGLIGLMTFMFVEKSFIGAKGVNDVIRQDARTLISSHDFRASRSYITFMLCIQAMCRVLQPSK